jgi:uncharacterized repeat protein (TIGR03803 family)
MTNSLGIAFRASLLTTALVMSTATSTSAAAGNTKIIYSFCKEISCADGDNGGGGSALLMDASGNLYGVTPNGGEHLYAGVVYELIANAKKSKWRYKRLHNFCARSNCVDGSTPWGALIMDTSGDLYGMTLHGGRGQQEGVVFELVPNADRSKWAYSVLHDFCRKTDCFGPGGELTYAGAATGALYDGVSPLYGTTTAGGAHSSGTAFELTPVAGQTKWQATDIYDFCSNWDGHFTCFDGKSPNGLVFDTNGNLYGTAQSGANGSGVVFELSPPAPAKKKWKQTVLYTFGQNSNDGSNPHGNLFFDGRGNLYGTTQFGGAFGDGTVFEVAPNGATSQEAVLYSFCALTNCADGAYPANGVIMDASGNLYGTTPDTPPNQSPVGYGLAFKLAFNGSTWQETVLHTFCSQANCSDGEYPTASLITDGSGNLFGTTQRDGANGQGGTVFELKP